ncbi:ABC-F family ATP-binding cassette domain-containing protein [Sorangium cellulosum]|uniref:Probable ATP-binding protein YbiT n=2 Tax=Sorangium cellulosum TaxID=56 RepID=A0A150TBC7_SORCE|nr:ATP-binding cassette domain-containing protein [Sorangium cellulosum]AGP32679.1 heme ABC transporter ATP-binding protein [Sorangium cellulosum So0157-2]KYG02015.1 ABC transporter ATP-binding protein [Sorangium cellulosum]
MITLEKLTKRYGPKILFENVSMRFDPGKRYVLVGANGAGKSTLLKVISGEEESDQGTVEIPKQLRVGVLKQDHFAYESSRILDTVLMGNRALWDAMQERDRLYEVEMTDEVGMRLAELEGTIGEEDGYTAEARAAEILEGLGIATARHTSTVSTLAGGYKLRVLIAQTLFAGADVLLLDEPTNHLDLDSIRWLEAYLTDTFRGTLLVVSHDRHFMNAIATHVADVDYQTVTLYTGDYDDFIEQKTTGKRQSDADAAQKKKKIAELKDFVARFGASASRSSQAQSRVKEIEKLEAGIQVRRSSVVRPYIKFEIEKPSGRDVLRVEGLAKSFGDLRVIQKLDFNLNRGDKLAVIGPSGIGKSTLLKLLVGELTPDAGKVTWGHDTNVGYFAQDHHEAIEPGFTAYDWLYRFDPSAPKEHVRSVLGKLLFSGEAGLKKTENLSGGEAARLFLAKLILVKNNVVVLDEPTNHLDVESIDALLQALIEYKGTVIVTSHDRHFVGKLGTRVLELSSRGPQLFNGTYDEYLEGPGNPSAYQGAKAS